MQTQNDFRIIVIDDNPSIHSDFQKILKMEQSRSENSDINQLGNLLFGESARLNQSSADYDQSDLPVFQIDCASQGEEGVKIVKNAIDTGSPYALAFVDIRMPPGIDGIETIKRIWEIDNEIQVVICTAYSDYSWDQTIEELGLRDNLLILKKPFDSLAVRQLTCSMTKKWRLMQDSKSREKNLESTVKERTESLQETLAKLEHQSSHDSLTNLPNRLLLQDRMTQAIHHAQRHNLMFAVVFIDLDRFKLINDSLSHEIGDELLKSVSDRLSKITREEDTIARLSGDEFVFVHIPTEVNSLQNLVNISSRILTSLNEPLHIADHDMLISASLGISIYPQDGTTVEELLRNADLAMYRAKSLGGNQFQIYTPELQQLCEQRLESEYELRNALINKEFFIEYQPKYLQQNDELKLVGVEALIRWQNPQKGLVYPMSFIPVAEETGLIVPIGEWVINTVCQQSKVWSEQGIEPFPIAVNVSTKQLMQPDFVSKVKQALDLSGLNPKYLEIEVTENTIMSASNVIDTILELKKLGLSLVLDDFGSGNSGFNYLHKLPIDQLKIDKSFIQHVGSDADNYDSIIVKAILDLANNLKLSVVAEGIETPNQLKFLKLNDCHQFQGFYFHKPMTADQLTEHFKKKS